MILRAGLAAVRVRTEMHLEFVKLLSCQPRFH